MFLPAELIKASPGLTLEDRFETKINHQVYHPSLFSVFCAKEKPSLWAGGREEMIVEPLS